jgi:hypothetical protein
MNDQNQGQPYLLVYLVCWSVAVPILAIWALVSFLPLVSILRAWGDFVDVLVAFGFLGTGALGLAAAAIALRWMMGDGKTQAVSTLGVRTLRAVALAAYAAVWMALYAVV